MDNSDLGRSVPDGLSSATPIEPVPVSAVPASIPRAFTSDWSGEVALAATEYGVSREALNAAIFTWLMKISRWEAANIDEVLKGLAREQQARMGLAMAMGDALAVAQAIEARRAETGTGAVHESAVCNADAPTPSSEPHHDQP